MFEVTKRPKVILFLTAALLAGGGIPAASSGDLPAASVGSIAGRVTDEAGDGLDVCVQIYLSDDPSFWYDETYSDPETGEFSIEMEPGEYKVLARDCMHPIEHAPTWYADAADFDDADPVVVDMGAQAYVEIAMPFGGSISGRVTDEQGQPLQPCVSVYDEHREFHSGWQFGNSDGTFTAGGLRSGTYFLEIETCSPFPEHAPEFHDDRPTIASADPISVTLGDDTSGVDASLEWVGASISGRVTSENGDPLERACIEVYDDDDGTLAGEAVATDGDYRVTHLEGGFYRIRFTDCGGTGHLTEWWDDQPDERNAHILWTFGGEDLDGIDAVLAAGPTKGSISGRVFEGLFTPSSGTRVELYDVDGDAPTASRIVDQEGTYGFQDVLAGRYHVRFVPDSEFYVAEWYRNAHARADAEEVEVVAGESTTDINAVLDRYGEIAGSVRDERNRSVAGACVDVHASAGSPIASGSTDGNGTFNVDGLDEGTYRVFVDPCEAGPYLGEWHADADGFSSATPISVTYGSTSSVLVRLESPRIRVLETDGTTEAEEGGAGDTSMVVLSDPPAGDVVLSLQGDDQVVAVPSTLTFTTQDWDQPQAVQVEAVDDDEIEDDPHAGAIALVASGDWTYAGLTADLAVTVIDNDPVPVPTELVYEGETDAVRGTEATLSATLTEAETGAAVPGRPVRFEVGSFSETGTTDDSGRASVEMTALQGFGSHEIEVVFEGDVPLEPTATSSVFEVRWEHVFADGGNAVRINTPTTELQLVVPEDTSEVKQDPSMVVEDLPTSEPHIRVVYRDADLALMGEFLYERGVFAAVAATETSAYVLRSVG